MKKLILNPATLIMVAFVSLVAFSNVCCTGKASNNENKVLPVTAAYATASENAEGVIALTDATFDQAIKKGVVLVDFWATWCRPCRMQAPIIEEVNTLMAGKAAICKLDVDKNPVISGRYGIQSIPTMLIFKDGKIAGKFLGVTAKEDIINELKRHIK